jgi:xanthine dehydrogenase iron-sulfur cluster and FAD-binding subunit A
MGAHFCRPGFVASLYNKIEEMEDDETPTIENTFTCNRGVWTGVLRCVPLSAAPDHAET